MSIAETILWFFVGATAGKSLSFSSKREKIEQEAARAEYRDLVEGNYEIDPALPEWAQKQRLVRYVERREQLLIRYPEALIGRPSRKYIEQGEQSYRENNPGLLYEIKNNWKWWVAALLALLAMRFGIAIINSLI